MVANGYLDFVGRAVFRNGPPRPRLRADEPAPVDNVDATPVNAGDEGAAAEGGEVAPGAGDDAVEEEAAGAAGGARGAGTVGDAVDASAAGAAANAGTAAAQARPPLSFFGSLNNIVLAFVTSLFPAWEALPQRV